MLPPGYHRHDGAYVRLQFGGGISSYKASANGTDVSITGGGYFFDFAVGGAVTDNVILFGELFIADADHPDGTVNGVSGGSVNGTLDVVGLGGGIAYYFPESNVYISGTIAAPKLEASDNSNNTTGTTNFGLGFSGQVGKEWWVSSDWGLGMAAQFIAARMKDRTDITPAPTWTTLQFGLLFSATYN
jgi:hypothetical protein